MPTNQLIDAARLLTLLAALSIASAQDLRTREVDDKVWLAASPMGALLTGLDLCLSFDQKLLLLTAVSVGLSSALALLIYHFGLFGGADAKAIMCTSVVAPYPPSLISPRFGVVNPVYPLTLLGNAVVISASLVILMALKNLRWAVTHKGSLFEGVEDTRLRKLLALLMGYKVRASGLKDTPHVRVMEVATGGGRRRFKFFTKVEEYELLSPRDAELSGEWVWVTPAVPLLAFFLAGFLCSIFIGDFVMMLVSSFI